MIKNIELDIISFIWLCLFHCACVTLNSTRTFVTLLMALFVKGMFALYFFWLGLYPVVFLPHLAMPRSSIKKVERFGESVSILSW